MAPGDTAGMTAGPIAVTVEEVPAGLTYPLRGAVLRPGRPVEIAGDDEPDTFHLAARTPAGQVVGVVRFHPAACSWRPDARAPWQLRGMATDPAVRGTGAGRALVAEGLARVAAAGGDLVWCDARVAAAGFYERMGFAVVTEPYEKATVGLHLGMVIQLSPRG
ncbi:MAG: GCN5-related N-acetyltransferase [Blastococcus sp.]|jgi:predicted GNAT family N-acyltransferase|nr:GCN5-related N-acetyltransferase [Blastococcus sp.]